MADPSFRDLVQTFARIGFLSFGGPAGQIALMHREIVEERGWVEEGQYLRALNFCHLLPGPEAQQLATWIGWRLHGTAGGLVAGLLFVLPGAAIILALSILYGLAARLDWFAALFLGIKAAVLAIVVQALVRVGGRALDTGFKRVLAAIAFVALFFLGLPFPIVVLGAGLAGVVAVRRWPEALGRIGHASDTVEGQRSGSVADTARTVAAGLLVWAAPMAAVLLLLGPDHVLWEIGAFFSQLAVVTFGGAYAVLSYMAQEAVQSHGWLSAGEMADGLGLAETTPGPLILVTQFVGYLGALRAPDPFSPLVAGIIGACLTTWVTFVPCFLWIFTFAPWMERMDHIRWLQGGLAALTAAVVGVIANLTLWFALHVLFTRVSTQSLGPVRISLPGWGSFDGRAALLTLLAALLLFRFGRSVLTTLTLCALAGLGLVQISL